LKNGQAAWTKIIDQYALLIAATLFVFAKWIQARMPGLGLQV
jgi:hypothetical protein